MTSPVPDFIFTAQPSRVVFARRGLDRLAAEVEALGAKRALVLCTPEQITQAEDAAALLGKLSAGIYPHARMHVPIETARHARAHAKEVGADCAVAIGGGDGRWFSLSSNADSYMVELDAFLNALAANAPMPATLRDGLRALRIANCALESATTGRLVKI